MELRAGTDRPHRVIATVQQGGGRVDADSRRVRLMLPSTTDRLYSNAQIGDPAGQLDWRPPLTLTVRARFSHAMSELKGTAGFGFWNLAFAPGSRGLRPPRALWFFAAGSPFDVPLALGVPGRGFKAATIDAQRWPFFALLPTAPLGVLLMRVPKLYRSLWPLAQHALGVAEQTLDEIDATELHTYELRWQSDLVRFAIDGSVVLITRRSPRGPLGFVAWIDNSYAIATPQGRFGFGLIGAAERQWLEVDGLKIGD